MSELLRISRKINVTKLNYQPIGIVMGKTGIGKSTLINKITGSTHPSHSSSSGVTQNLHMNTTNIGAFSFQIMDTPGTDSTIDTYKHAYQLWHALTSRSLNTIFIMLKYEPRYDKIVKSFFEEQTPVDNFAKKIVVIISCWDQSEEKEKDFACICKEFEPLCSNIIFYSKLCDSSYLANIMYGFMSNMISQRLDITNHEFLLKFNVATVPTKIEMYKSYREYTGEANKLTNDYEELIKLLKEVHSTDRDEFLHGLLTEFNNEMQNNLEKYRQKYKVEMIDLDFYCFDIKMQNDILKRCEVFTERIKPLMSEYLFNPKDARNMIKMCPYPHCGIIWFKTEGCNGQTECGKKVQNWYDFIGKPFKRISFFRDTNGQLKWKKSEKPQMENAERTRPLANGKEQRRVCGQKITWSEMCPVDEKIILELFEVATIDQANERVNKMIEKESSAQYSKMYDVFFYD